MNMIYTDETLYINLTGNGEFIDYNNIKNKIFSVVKQYDVDNVVINTSGVFNKNRYKISSLKRHYNRIYNGNIKIV